MNNAENNPTQSQQNEIQARSPAGTPAQETSRANPATMAAEFGDDKAHHSVSESQGVDPDPMPGIDLNSITADTPDPVQRANSRIVSVDSANMDASDSTVDTDGKGLDAMRDRSPLHDNVVGTNATLVNNVAAPAHGLGGIDSRSDGNRPQIALRAGWTMTYQGCTETTGCVFRGSWTRVSHEGGQVFRAKLDSRSAATQGVSVFTLTAGFRSN